MPKVLVSGCSYTNNTTWPSVLFPDCEIVNLGKPGAGNTYISESIIDYVINHDDVSRVFVLFSGVNRTDVVAANTPMTKKYLLERISPGAISTERCYFFADPHTFNRYLVRAYRKIKTNQWPEIRNSTEYLELPESIRQECENKKMLHFFKSPMNIETMIHQAMMLHYLDNPNYLSEKTYRAVLLCTNFLASRNIPFNFSFFYNPWDVELKRHFGILNKQSKMHDQIDWSKYIDLTPFEFAIEHDFLQEDGVHMTIQGGEHWAGEIKKCLS